MAARSGGGHSGWSRALTDIAMTRDPVLDNIPAGTQVVHHDDHTITIADKWPKARHHLLVLPRIPFRLHQEGDQVLTASTSGVSAKQSRTLSLAAGGLLSGLSRGNNVPASHLQSLTSLLASPYAAEVLAALRRASERAVEYIGQAMKDDTQTLLGGAAVRCRTWGIQRAFHAIPSMQTVHLHVYSDELVSPALKTLKHYNSFKPDHGFALTIDTIERLVAAGETKLPHTEAHYAALLKAPLIGRDGQRYANMPKLKAHLEAFWHAQMLAKSGSNAAHAESSTASPQMTSGTTSKHRVDHGDDRQGKMPRLESQHGGNRD